MPERAIFPPARAAYKREIVDIANTITAKLLHENGQELTLPDVLQSTSRLVAIAQGRADVKPIRPAETVAFARTVLTRAIPLMPQGQPNAEFLQAINVIEDTARAQEVKKHPKREAFLQDATSAMEAVVGARGIAHADILAKLVVNAVVSPSDAGSLAQLAQGVSGMSSEAFAKFVEQMPSILVGKKHHTAWQRASEYDERWKPRDLSVEGEEAWIANAEAHRAAYGEYPEGVTLLGDYRATHEGRTPAGMDPDLGDDVMIMDIKNVPFERLSPGRQRASSYPAEEAFKAVKEEQEAGHGRDLARAAKIVHNVLFEGADFKRNLDPVKNPRVAIMHKLGEKNHKVYLENNASYANGLTIQNYYDMLDIALGNWDKVRSKIRTENTDTEKGLREVPVKADGAQMTIYEEVMDWALHGQDSPIESMIARKLAASRRRGQAISAEEIMQQALQQFAQGMINSNIQITEATTSYAQGVVKEDLRFPDYAYQVASNLATIL